MGVTAKKPLAQPHNCYNIFFILEREKLIRARQGSRSSGEKVVLAASGEPESSSSSFGRAGYCFLRLPDLPPRYQDLVLSHDWYVPGKNANRKHVKNAETHGLTSFTGLAKTVATNWKAADDATKDYCNTVAHIIKERHAELKQFRGIIDLLKEDSNVPKSKEKSKHSKRKVIQQQRRRNQWCLPRSSSMGHDPSIPFVNMSVSDYTIRHVTLGSANEIPLTNAVQQQHGAVQYMTPMMSSPPTNNHGTVHRSSSMGDQPSLYPLDNMGLVFPIVPFSSTRIITPDLLCSLCSNTPKQANRPNHRDNNLIKEVDISDSDIFYMWTSNSF
jgi:hypothetical protein